MQRFAEWAPDVAPWNADVAAEASGVICGPNSYEPLAQPAVSSVAAGTVIRGAYAARTSTNAVKIFAFSATKAYEFAGISTAWTDRTNAGGDYVLGTDEYWSSIQYGTNVIFVNGADDVQTIAAAGGGAATDLAGSPPDSRYVAVIGDFVFLGATATSRLAIKNSARNDATGWTQGQKDSDGQTFPDGGDVMGIVGFELGGLVFQTETVRRISLRQDAAIYETHRIDVAHGTTAPYSIISHGLDVYYYSTAGFIKLGMDGSFSQIGHHRVDEWFLENSNIARRKAIIGCMDPVSQNIFWLFPTAQNASSTTLDGLLIYDTLHEQWTHATVALTYIFRAASPGVTLAGLAALYAQLNLVPYPLGSDVWKGGAPGVAAFDSSNRLCFFTGTPMAASVQTSQFEAIPGKRAFIQGFRLYGDAANATGRIGGAARPQDSVTWNAYQAVNAQGRIPARISTRLCQIQVDIPAGETWTHLAGADFDGDDVSDDGER